MSEQHLYAFKRKVAGTDPFFLNPGEWAPLDGPEGDPSASVACPMCGTAGVLLHHKIGEDGAVTPSLACLNPGCDFHRFVRLENWP